MLWNNILNLIIFRKKVYVCIYLVVFEEGEVFLFFKKVFYGLEVFLEI